MLRFLAGQAVKALRAAADEYAVPAGHALQVYGLQRMQERADAAREELAAVATRRGQIAAECRNYRRQRDELAGQVKALRGELDQARAEPPGIGEIPDWHRHGHTEAVDTQAVDGEPVG